MRFFGRKWAVTIGTKLGTLEAGLKVTQLRVFFDIVQTSDHKPNTCVLRVWNLSKRQRSIIIEQSIREGKSKGIPVRVEAGYQEGGPFLLFEGDLRTATVALERGDWVTTIESGDGEAAKQFAQIHRSFGAGTTVDIALREAVSALGIPKGNLDRVAAEIRRGSASLGRVVLSGSAWLEAERLCRAAGYEFGVLNGSVQITKRGAPLNNQAVRLAPGRGLVGSPSVDAKGVLSATSYLQPGLDPKRLLVLDSPTVKGNFKIERARKIGDSAGKDWYAEVEAKRY